MSVAQEGQVWYNTTSTVLKSFGAQGPSVWASGTSLNTGRVSAQGCGTSVSAAIVAAGQDPSPANTNAVETYDGSTWTEEADTNSDHIAGLGAGSQTAFLVAGGSPSSIPTGYVIDTEEWNGTSWTEVNNMLVGKATAAGSGSTADAKLAGGLEKNPNSSPNFGTNTVEDWDGTCWSNGTSLSRPAEYGNAGLPSSPATTAMVFGGLTFPPHGSQTTLVELWNGSSWTEKNDFSNARHYTTGGGTSTAAIIAGGNPNRSDSQTFDGTNWTTIASLAQASWSMTGAGTSTSFMVSGGDPSPVMSQTQILAGSPAIKTFTAS